MFKSCVLITLCAGALTAADFITGQAARAVIGQTTFTDNTSGTSDTKFGSVGGLASGGNTLFITDANRLGFLPVNHRVLVYNNLDQLFPPVDASIPPGSGRCPLCGGAASFVMGQADFTGMDYATARNRVRTPVGVATDGIHVAVADTLNNRVLLYNSIPTTNGVNADVVLGQPDFTTNTPGIGPDHFRAPQGVWIQDGRLFVADSSNNRVLIWNSLPTTNDKPADVVLGQPNFTTAPPSNLINLSLPGGQNLLLTPVAVSSDGVRLIVSDLGYNRVLIWNSIPTQNQQPADVVVGQIDFTKTFSNQSRDLCAPNGTDTDGNNTYPVRCAATLNFPRFAISDGTRLYIADGGNDRVLIFNQIPTTNGARADVILGQANEFDSIITTSNPQFYSASNVTPTPTSLAWDGQNLYVTDPTDYRVLVFTPGSGAVETSGVVNAASRAIFALGSVAFGGTIKENDTVTVTVMGTDYKYTVLATDTVESVAVAIANMINGANDGAGDPNVNAIEQNGRAVVVLVAKSPGTEGTTITLATMVSANATIAVTASGANLTGGGNASIVAPGTLLTIKAAPGASLADDTVVAPPDADPLPFELGGVEVYVDGYRTPLVMVSPTEVTTQIPYETTTSTSVSVYVRTVHRVKDTDGNILSESVSVTNAIGLQLNEGAPGIFACDPAGLPTACNAGGAEPRAVPAMHASSFSTATISIDGSIQAGDIATLTIGDVPLTYTVVATDTLATVRDQLIGLINNSAQMPVTASAANQFTRIRLQAKIPGPEGSGTAIFTQVTTAATNTQGAVLSVAATNSGTCCANSAGRLATPENPVVPGESIVFLATGLGLVTPDDAKAAQITGSKYNGPAANTASVNVSATVGGNTGNVISAAQKVGAVGIYEVVVELSSGLSENPLTLMSLSQIFSTSNVVTLPVGTPPQN